MSHIKHIFMSCLLALAAIGLQAATPTPAAKVETPAQPISPLTITVKQTGESSWKTLYKVPVEISITNNTDKVMNADFIKTSLLSPDTTRSLTAFLIGAGLALILWSVSSTLLTTQYSYFDMIRMGLITCCTGLSGLSVAQMLAAKQIFRDSIAGFGILLFALVISQLSSTQRKLPPHMTKTFKCSISTSDLQKIRDVLTPELVKVIA